MFLDRTCIQPWINVDIYWDGEVWVCCPGWMNTSVGNLLRQSWDDIWNGEIIRKIRQSMLDSTFEYCKPDDCIFLLDKEISWPMYATDSSLSENLEEDWGNLKPIKKYYKNKETYDPIGPAVVTMSYDRSCNLQCPTCRHEIEMYTPKNPFYNQLLKIHKIVTEVVCKDADQIIVSGSGDAFGSVLHRDFMRKFDKKNYPKVEFIYPMTNAVLWDKKMWDSMKGVHPYVKSCYISIDAVTSETYNKVRTLKPSHGNFEQLIENLKFINTIPDLKRIALTFVVSELNYFEVDKFLDMKRYFPDKDIEFRYYKIMDWGHLGKKYGEYAIHEENHPKYKDFLGYWEECEKKIKSENLEVKHNLHGLSR